MDCNAKIIRGSISASRDILRYLSVCEIAVIPRKSHHLMYVLGNLCRRTSVGARRMRRK